MHWLALSGGADSVALLHLLHQLPDEARPPLSVVHVHHGLSEDANGWLLFCQQVADKLGIPFHSIRLDYDHSERRRLGVEGWARTARYAAIAELIGEGDVVHCAQHQSDQAETLILALMRGAGSDGQASMPILRKLGSGWLCRPLLDFTRADLQEFALQEQGEWVEDPSNSDKSFDRNFIRSEILPVMAERWPSANRSLARAASLAGEASDASQWFARRMLAELLIRGECLIVEGPSRSQPSSIAISAFADLPIPVRNQLLRQWVVDSGVATLPHAKMAEIDESMLPARSDKNPFLTWGNGVYLGRFRNRLWLFNEAQIDWPATINLDQNVACDGGSLSLVASDEGFAIPEGGLRITRRQGGERFSKQLDGHSTLLKKFLNEKSVLPWWRDHLPLLWSGKELVAIGDLWQRKGNGGWRVAWSPAPVLTAS
jgi:tRNA(Ile)-lysidine synthase